MLCDVCNTTIPRDEGETLSPDRFRALLAKGWGVHETNISMIMTNDLSHDKAKAILHAQYTLSISPWLLCPECLTQALEAERKP
jgi:hypothetical protein